MENKYLKENVTILVNSCDKYSDIWNTFFDVFALMWPDCPCRILLNTETKVYHHPKLQIECGQLYSEMPKTEVEKIPWSNRLMKTLDMVKTKYVLFLLEDVFLQEKVEEAEIENLIKKVDSFRHFGSLYIESHNPDRLFFDSKKNLYKLSPWTPYSIFDFAGLWNTDSLRKTLVPGERAWGHEWFGSQREVKSGRKHYMISNLHSPIKVDFYAQVVKGKWSKRAVDFLRKTGIEVDFAKRGIVDFDPPFTQTNRASWSRKIRQKSYLLYCLGDMIIYYLRRYNGK